MVRQKNSIAGMALIDGTLHTNIYIKYIVYMESNKSGVVYGGEKKYIAKYVLFSLFLIFGLVRVVCNEEKENGGRDITNDSY